VTRVVWTLQAVEDLEAIRAYIARDSPHYAALMVERIVETIERLKEFPRSGRRGRAARAKEATVIVDAHWSILFNAASFRFSEPGLYAYLHPLRGEILYIGRARRGPLQRCFQADRKTRVIDFLSRKRRLKTVWVMVARLIADQPRRLSSEQLSGIAALLVRRVQPTGNSETSRRYVSSAGLVVQCRGDWPYDQLRYVSRRATIPRRRTDVSESSALPNRTLHATAGGGHVLIPRPAHARRG